MLSINKQRNATARINFTWTVQSFAKTSGECSEQFHCLLSANEPRQFNEIFSENVVIPSRRRRRLENVAKNIPIIILYTDFLRSKMVYFKRRSIQSLLARAANTWTRMWCGTNRLLHWRIFATFFPSKILLPNSDYTTILYPLLVVYFIWCWN